MFEVNHPSNYYEPHEHRTCPQCDRFLPSDDLDEELSDMCECPRETNLSIAIKAAMKRKEQ